MGFVLYQIILFYFIIQSLESIFERCSLVSFLLRSKVTSTCHYHAVEETYIE